MFERIDLPTHNCGGDPIVVQVIGRGFRVICPTCHHTSGFHKAEDQAVDEWNGGPEHRLELEETSWPS